MDSEVVAQLFQKLSILLVKGNAALLLSRLPSEAHFLHYISHATNLNHFLSVFIVIAYL